MTLEQKYLIEILKAAVRGEGVMKMPEEDIRWPELIREAKSQAVWLPVYDALAPVDAGIPLSPEAMEQDALSFVGNNIRVEQAQAELVHVLERLQCPYVILKGLSSAAWYPKAQTRHLGDVDFLVPAERTGEITRQMVQRGYTHKYYPGSHHQNLRKQDVLLEMHMQIAGIPEEKGRAELQCFLAPIYDRRQLRHTEQGSFYVPCDEHQAVIQLLHMQGHILSGGIGLRHVMDWGCFVNANAQRPFWQEQVLPLMKQTGLFYFTAVITKTASLYLGTVCPVWAEYADDGLCRELMEDVLTGGNFGCKDPRRNHCFGLFPDWEQQSCGDGKLRRLYKSLRKTVLQQHPKLQGRPVATFFSMVCKAARYTVLQLFGKRPDLGEVAALAEQREAVYSRLRMFEKGDGCDF